VTVSAVATILSKNLRDGRFDDPVRLRGDFSARDDSSDESSRAMGTHAPHADDVILVPTPPGSTVTERSPD